MHAPLAYILPGYGEVVVLLIIGLLLFGRRLPEVGRQLGRTVTEFRRGLSGLRHQLEQDQDMREIRSGIGEVKRALDAPRQLANPMRVLEGLTDESRATPGPEAERAPELPGGPFEMLSTMPVDPPAEQPR